MTMGVPMDRIHLLKRNQFACSSHSSTRFRLWLTPPSDNICRNSVKPCFVGLLVNNEELPLNLHNWISSLLFVLFWNHTKQVDTYLFSPFFAEICVLFRQENLQNVKLGHNMNFSTIQAQDYCLYSGLNDEIS